MKNVALILMMCFGMMACGVEQDSAELSTDEASLNVDEGEILKAVTFAPNQIRYAKEVKLAFGVEDVGVMACPFLGEAPCNGTYNCAFECCSGAIRTVQEPCGYCTWRANSWCGSGTKQVWWY